MENYKHHLEPIFSVLEQLKGKKNYTSYSLSEFSKEWFLITRIFGLNAPYAIAHMSKLIQRLSCIDEKTKPLEKLLQSVTAIAIDDLGLSRGQSQHGLLHFRLFEEMCQPLIVIHPEIVLNDFPRYEQTKILISCVEKSFTSENVIKGIVQFFIVENIALSIVNMMYPLYKNCKGIDGNLIYPTDDMLEYVIMHQHIEGEHGSESSAIISEYLSIFPEEKEKLNDIIKDYSSKWHLFFQCIYKDIFSK